MKWEVVRQKTFASIGVVPMATGKQLAAAGMTVERHSSGDNKYSIQFMI